MIDNIGLLSSLYQYGSIAYIGGGFGAGIHNTLEAAAFGLPVIFGPRYDKFQEAKDLVALQAAISISDDKELENAFQFFIQNPDSGKKAQAYVAAKKGATAAILQEITALPPLIFCHVNHGFNPFRMIVQAGYQLHLLTTQGLKFFMVFNAHFIKCLQAIGHKSRAENKQSLLCLLQPDLSSTSLV